MLHFFENTCVCVLEIKNFALQAIFRSRKTQDIQISSIARVLLHGAQCSGAGIIAEVDAYALGCGVQPGMTLAQAQQRGHIEVYARDVKAEEAMRQTMLDIALSFAPAVEFGKMGDRAWVAFDIAGLQGLKGTTTHIAREVHRTARTLMLSNNAYAPARLSVGIARHKYLSQLAARAACALSDKSIMIITGALEERRFIDALPVAALTDSPFLLELWQRFGLNTGADLRHIPIKEWSERFGAEGIVLAHKLRGDPYYARLNPVPVHDSFIETAAFDFDAGLTQIQPILFVLRGLIDRLVQRLELRALWVGHLRLSLSYSARMPEGQTQEHHVHLSHATRDIRALLELCRVCLENKPHTEEAYAIHYVRVVCTPKAGRPQQLSLFCAAGPAPDKLALTLARLRALCGDENVGAFAVTDSYRPDRFSIQPFRPRAFAEHETEQVTSKNACVAVSALRRYRPPLGLVMRGELRVGRRLHCVHNGCGPNGRVVRIEGPYRYSYGWWQGDGGFCADVYDVRLHNGGRYRVQYDTKSWWALGRYD